MASLKSTSLFAFKRTDGRLSFANGDDISGTLNNIKTPVTAISWRPDSVLTWAGGDNGQISYYQGASQVDAFEVGLPVNKLDYNSDGSLLAALNGNKVLIYNGSNLSDIVNPEYSLTIEGVNDLEFVKIGEIELLAMGKNDRKVYFWDYNGDNLYTRDIVGAPSARINKIDYFNEDSIIVLGFESNNLADVIEIKSGLDVNNRVTFKGTKRKLLEIGQQVSAITRVSGLYAYLTNENQVGKVGVWDPKDDSIEYFPLKENTRVQCMARLKEEVVFGTIDTTLISFNPLDLPYERVINDSSEVVSGRLIIPVVDCKPNFDFGTVCISQQKDTLFESITLNTVLPFRIDSISGLDNSVEFSVTTSFPFYINKNGQSQLEFVFSPIEPEGSKQANAVIHHQYGTCELELTGIANAPKFELFFDTLDLGKAMVGESLSKDFAILRNTDSSPLDIKRVLNSGDQVEIISNVDTIIPSSGIFRLRLDAVSAIDTIINGHLYIYSDKECSPIILPYKVEFIGYDITFSPEAYILDTIDCSSNRLFDLEISNNSERAIEIDVNPGQYIQNLGSSSLSIPANQKTQLSFSVSPLIEGEQESNITFLHPSDLDNNNQSEIIVRFTYDSIVTRVSPKSLIFRPQEINRPDTLTFNLLNDNLSFQKILIQNFGSDKFFLSDSILELGPNTDTVIKAIYRGGKTGDDDNTVFNIEFENCGQSQSVTAIADFGDSDALLIIDEMVLEGGECKNVPMNDTVWLKNLGQNSSLILSEFASVPELPLNPERNNIAPGDSVALIITLPEGVRPNSIQLKVYSNSIEGYEYIKNLEIDLQSLSSFTIPETFEVGELNPYSQYEFEIPLEEYRNLSSDMISISENSTNKVSNVQVLGSSININYLSKGVGQAFKDTLILYESKCGSFDTVVITGATNSNFYLTSSLRTAKGDISLTEQDAIILNYQNPFAIDLENLDSIVYYLSYNDSLIGFSNAEITDGKLKFESNSLIDFLDSYSYSLITVPAYSLADSAHIIIDSVKSFGINELTIRTSSLSFALIDKEAFSDTRIFRIGPGIGATINSIPFIEGDLEITLTLAEADSYELSLWDSYGKECYRESIIGPTDSAEITIPAKHLSSGVYFLMLSNSQRHDVFKFSIVK